MTEERLVRKEISRVIEACHTTTLMTVDEIGRPWARRMSDHNDGAAQTLRLQTSARTHKVAHLRAHAEAGLCYFLPDERRYVFAAGTCRVVDDPVLRERHFRESLRRYWPQGPTDIDYVLLAFNRRSYVYYPGLQVGHFPPRIDAWEC